MEASCRSKHGIIKDQTKKDRSSDGEREVLFKLPLAMKMEKSSVELDSVTSSSSRHDQDEELESARVEMGEVREENQRLRTRLDQILSNYRMLQMQFDTIVRRDGNKNTMSSTESLQQVEETDLVALTLGRFPIVEKAIGENIMNSRREIKRNDQQIKTRELALGLESNFDGSRSSDRINALSPKGESPSSNSNKDFKEGEEEENPCPPSKSLKTMTWGEDEVKQENPPKKARVCVRARCDTPTMNDGCQWRKYGQKIAKGNPCPRAYYRCTGAQSCPVKKQVQRCSENMSILITTYEGTHNHPLSVSATAMASTTSAAAAMLLSGSSSTHISPNPSAAAATTTTQANLNGLNFHLSDSSNSKQFYLPNSFVSTSSPTHPTITIDLTSNPSSSSSSYNGSSFSSSYPPRYPFTNLDFGSSRPNLLSWTNGLLGYGNQMETFDIGTSMQKTNNFPAASVATRLPLLDPIAAATKAITVDPNFQSALATALTSFIGNSVSSSRARENFLEKLKSVEKLHVNGCGSSFNDSTPAKNSLHGNLTFLPTNPLPFSTSKSASTSPGDSRDHQTSR